MNTCATRVFTDMPVVRGPRGVYRDNVVKRSPRDIEAAGERATQRAAQALEKFMRTPGRRLVAVRPDGTFVSPELPPGDYLLCGLVRPREPHPRARRTHARPARLVGRVHPRPPRADAVRARRDEHDRLGRYLCRPVAATLPSETAVE